MSSIASFEQLIQALDQTPPKRKHTDQILQDLALTPEALTPYSHFCRDQYCRNLIYRHKNWELLLLCWQPGQMTPIHDHAGAEGWVYLVQGSLREEVFELDPATKLYRHHHFIDASEGDVTYINDSIGLHRIINQGQTPSISLHLYSPTVSECQYFDESNWEAKTRSLSNYSEYGKILPKTQSSMPLQSVEIAG